MIIPKSLVSYITLRSDLPSFLVQFLMTTRSKVEMHCRVYFRYYMLMINYYQSITMITNKVVVCGFRQINEWEMKTKTWRFSGK